MASEPIKHLINEQKREIFFPGGGVELSVVHADSEDGDGSRQDELVVSFRITVIPPF